MNNEDAMMIMQESDGSEHILGLLNIRRQLVEQGLELSLNSLEDAITKEILIVAMDTDRTYRSVYNTYQKDFTKGNVAAVVPIKKKPPLTDVPL